ncbi:MAG: putative lipase, alpha/beta hydrolase family [Nocardia sp.]|nr:putative lipase, alpha/beta hydrolase family [Nocardia sp.]
MEPAVGRKRIGGVYTPLLADEGYCVYSLTYGAYDLAWPLSALGGRQPTDYCDHLALVASPRAAGFILNALDPTRQRPVPCEFIAPIAG